MKISEIFEKFFSSSDFSVLADISKKAYKFHCQRLVANSSDSTVFSHVGSGPIKVEGLERAFLSEGGLLVSNDNKVAYENFFWFLVLEKIPSVSSRMASRRVLRLVFSWARKQGFVYQNAMQNLRSPKVNEIDHKPFTKEEMERMYDLIMAPDFPSVYHPYLRMAYFCFLSGLRPNEADSLRKDCVRHDGFIEIVGAKHREKGKVSRLCRITERIAHVLGEGPSNESPLVFSSSRGKRLNKDQRCKAIKAACSHLGIEPRDFYSTRRGTATEMFKAGYDVAKIAGQLGHKKITTTMIYIRPSMKETAETYKGF